MKGNIELAGQAQLADALVEQINEVLSHYDGAITLPLAVGVLEMVKQTLIMNAYVREEEDEDDEDDV